MNQNLSTPSTGRQTKIIATLGPASSSAREIEALCRAGANLFRINFSHADHDKAAQTVDTIRKLEKKLKRPIGILADLQGPKLRIGTFENGAITIKPGMIIRFDLDKTPGNEKRVELPHPEIIKTLQKDDLVFLDDGKVRGRVSKKGRDYIEVTIKAGSKLSNKKGLNVPGVVLPIPALTKKDKSDLKAALDMGVDWIAQSFVQQPKDVKEALKLIGGRAALMVKLEKPAALDCLHELIPLVDGVMIARGDLGIEIPPENVPSVQKKIIRMVREAGKPVVVATQMLESMITNARPTRAEASDVATAVYDGADAVMLSAETASGDYPVQAVEFMNKIAERTEHDELYYQMMEDMRPEADHNASDAISTAAYYVAQDIDASVIVTYTMSGSTALRAARQRPDMPILCLTPDINVARRLTVSFGVRPAHAPETVEDFAGPARHAAKMIRQEGLAQKGEYFVMTAGVPFGVSGTTNILRIGEV